ncbi:MAG: hypothetical protein KDA42_09945 [Planctomycetales bacterium]|nr:hypothetical protein [Planctomycetales bacterium]
MGNALLRPFSAQAQEISAPGGTREGDRLIAEATERFAKHASVRALIHTEVDVWGHRFTGKGRYLLTRREGDELSRLELELELRANAKSTQGRTTKLLEVNDGRYLWRERTDGESREAERIDLARAGAAATNREVANSWSVEPFALQGGLETMLEALRKNFEFSKVAASRIDNVPVLRTIGHWRPECLAEILSDDKITASNASKKAPKHLPREVSVTLGRDDLFPYEVDFRAGDQGGAGERNELTETSIRYRFYEVVLGVEIDPRYYVYKPGDIIVEDVTDKFLKQRK